MATGSTPCAHTEWRHCRPATPAYTRAQDTSWAAAVAAKLGGRVAFQAQIAGKEGEVALTLLMSRVAGLQLAPQVGGIGNY